MIRYSILKQELQALAIEIHTNKIAFKNKQRTNCANYHDFYHAAELSSEFRYNLVAYSLLRGRTYEQIESNVGKGNEVNMDGVQKIMEAYAILHAKEVEAHEALSAST
jgi:uncharacterized protein YerC